MNMFNYIQIIWYYPCFVCLLYVYIRLINSSKKYSITLLKDLLYIIKDKISQIKIF